MLSRVTYFLFGMLSVVTYTLNTPACDDLFQETPDPVVHSLSRKMNNDESLDTVVVHYDTYALS